jgi:hypothetical protein
VVHAALAGNPSDIRPEIPTSPWSGREKEPTLITAVEPAGNLVTQIMTQAEGLLRTAPRQLDH